MAESKTVSAAADAEDQRGVLVAMRARVARDIDDPDTPARDIAALTRRLLEIVREIAAIDAHTGDGDDVQKAAQTPDEAWNPAAI